MATAAIRKKPSIVRVLPIPRKSDVPPSITKVIGSPINVSFPRATRASPSHNAPARRAQVQKLGGTYADRAAHIGVLRGRIRGLLQEAADPRVRARGGSSLLEHDRYRFHDYGITESDGSNLARLLSILLEESQSQGINIQGSLHRILTEIDSILKEDVEQQLRVASEQSDRRVGDLALRFEQTIRQREGAHLREVTELSGRIEYLQDELRASREMREDLEEQLEVANLELIERSQDMGSIKAEIEDLRREVKELRAYKAKHKQEMQNIDRLMDELEKHKFVAKRTLEEFAKLESERDELQAEFDKSLQKLRQSNQRRHQAIVAELDEAEDELLT